MKFAQGSGGGSKPFCIQEQVAMVAGHFYDAFIFWSVVVFFVSWRWLPSGLTQIRANFRKTLEIHREDVG